MKPPRPPPKPSTISSQKLALIDDREYYHWDQLRHLTPPKGLSKEEWWSGIKFLRGKNARQGGLFTFNLPDSLLEPLHTLDLTLSLPFEEVLTPFDTLSHEAITSSQIEGAATTRKIAKEMLRLGRAPRTKGEQMILNNFQAMQHLRMWKEKPLTLGLIKEIHKIVTKDTLEKPGSLRTPRDKIEIIEISTGEVLHTPPDAQRLPKRLQVLCNFANQTTSSPFIHPIIRAIILHFWLAYEHPFPDGNGRTARALFYWLALKEGYWLFEYLSISDVILHAPARYGRAFLYTESDENDVTYFILHQMDVIQKAIRRLEKRVQEKIASMPDLPDLNQRQILLIGHALKHPHARYSITGHQNSHEIAYETARKDLLDLVKKRYLKKKKRGKAFYFERRDDLTKRVKGSLNSV